MTVCLRELGEFGFVVNARVSQFEGTRSTSWIGFDISDTGNFGQIASDRGGTTTSVHVGDF